MCLYVLQEVKYLFFAHFYAISIRCKMDPLLTASALEISYCAFTDSSFSELLKKIRGDPTITALTLDSVTLSKEHLQRLLHTLQHDAKHVQSLTLTGQDLHMRGTISMFTTIARMGTPRLCLKRNGMGDAPLLHFALNMQYVRHITHLNLDSNGLTAASAKVLAHFLPLQTKVEHVSLCHNPFCSTGVIQLASGLVNCVTLKSLLLADTGADDHGAVQLAKVLINLPAFKELDLSSNPLVQSIGWKGMCFLVQYSSVLRRLDLSNTNPDFDSTMHMSTALKHNFTLQTLDYNTIPMMYGDEDAQESENLIVQYLMRNQQGN